MSFNDYELQYIWDILKAFGTDPKKGFLAKKIVAGYELLWGTKSTLCKKEFQGHGDQEIHCCVFEI